MTNDRPQPLRIAKYPNRRYYDATRSCHVTLDDLHRLICDGYDLTIVDSKSGDDITNAVLTQILLDRDPPKLELLPPALLHHVIRSNRQTLRAYLDRFVGQMVTGYAAYQEQMGDLVRRTMGANPMVAPALDWTRSMMKMFMPPSALYGDADAGAPAGPGSPPVGSDEAYDRSSSDAESDRAEHDHPGDADLLQELRAQLAALQAEVKALRSR